MSKLQFSELMETAMTLGFDVVDSGNMPVNEPMQMGVEDDNLMSEHAHLTFRDQPEDSRRAIVADVAVGEQTYHLVGDPRHIGELRDAVMNVPNAPRRSSEPSP